jgi:putative FmdB family regulatory protein
MPIYAYRCPACQADFEVSRRLADRAAPAFCPMDGAEGKRLMTAPNVAGQAVDPASAPKATAPAAKRWSHFGHSHTGGGTHSHGGPAASPPAPTSD